MSGWPSVRFEQLAADEKSSFSKPYGSAYTKGDYVPSGVPLVRGVNLGDGIFHDQDFVFIAEAKADKVPGANLGPGDLVITHRGTIGQISMIPRNPRYPRYVLSTSQVKARLDSRYAVPEFYYYWFSSPVGQHELLSHVSTVGVPGLVQPVATVKSLRVPHPPLAEQKAIADLLEALDDKISANRSVAETARDLGMAFFVAAKERMSKLVPLESVAVYLNRGQAPKYTDDEESILVLNQKCVRKGRVELDPARRTIAARVHQERRLIHGDILVNSTGVGTLGRVGIWSHDVRATVDSHITIVRINAAFVPSIIGGFAVLSAQSTIEALGDGSTGQTELSRSKLGRIRIDIPYDGHRVLAQKLNGLEGRADAALRECRTLAALRETLLPELMSGRLRVRSAERMVEGAV